MDIYKMMERGTPNGFNPIFSGKDIIIGVSRVVSRWPFPEFSNHPKDELLIVLRGQVEVEYEDKKTVIIDAGGTELMPKGRGHKVHNVARQPSDVMLIFCEQKVSSAM